jgi:hypothetical protein
MLLEITFDKQNHGMTLADSQYGDMRAESLGVDKYIVHAPSRLKAYSLSENHETLDALRSKTVPSL